MKVALTVACVLIGAFAISDAVVAHGARPAPAGPGAQVRITACGRDGATRRASASGTVTGAEPGYGFSIAFTDAAGDEQDVPATVAAGRFAVRSSAAFPAGPVRCAVAVPPDSGL